MEADKIVLEGCEVGCIPVESELIACPLNEEEVRKCPRRLGYLAGIREVVKWIEEQDTARGYLCSKVICSEELKAKLKEWGIK